jgi:alginate O-acetyltransferase complex protein AlgI
MTAAMSIYKAMLGLNGMSDTAFREFGSIPYRKPEFFQTMLVGLLICVALPPTITLQRWVPQAGALAGRPRLAWVFTAGMALFTVILLGVCVSKLGSYSPFLYFQF